MAAKSLEDMNPAELLAYTREKERSAKILDDLLADPKSRESTLRMVKEQNPKMPIPELDTKAALEARMDAQDKRNEELAAQIQERDIKERIEKERQRVMRTYELNEADMSELEKLMVDEKISSYDGAAKVLKAGRVLAVPTSHHLTPPMFEMPERDVWKKGIGNKAMLDKIGLKVAYDAYNQIHGAGKKAA